MKNRVFDKATIQFSFYSKGYGKDGTVKALVIRKGRRYVVDSVKCKVDNYTRKRNINPVFVVECVGHLQIKNDIAYILKTKKSIKK